MDLSQAVGQFSDDLFKLVVPKSHDENALVSPLSLSIAMSMLMAGAKNNSQLQLRNVLKLPAEVDVSEVHNCYNHLLTSYSELNKSNEAKEQILINNMALVSKLFGLLSEYQEDVKVRYQTEIYQVDFAKEGRGIVANVNEWANKSTKGLIPTVLSSPLPADTQLMLMNSVYFKGHWAEKFSTGGTRDFHLSNTEKKKVPFMSGLKHYKYLKVPFNCIGESVEMVEIPYEGHTRMVLMLPPKSASANDLISEKSLYDLLMKLVTGGMKEKILLSLPKFTFDFNINMSGILSKLGAQDVFSPTSADLTGVTEDQEKRLFVSQITHSTVIEVDEKGTKAAAVTGELFFSSSFSCATFVEFSHSQ